ncbi:MAG TPA: glycine betaine ABC transporter substrate-binding protein [Burkholderiales bacterium]|nr:glycine betaine ABC transporter substrate-binding protein [Burkholderiales bacterium]
MHSLKKIIASLAAAVAIASPGAFAQSRFVNLGHVDLSIYEVTAAVVQNVLERLRYNVAVKKGSHVEMYPLLEKGEIDVFVAAWLPGAHAAYWEQVKDRAVIATTLYEDARLFWAVPDYVPASEVRSVEDLRKPSVSAKMQKEIRGTRPDSGLVIGSKKVMEEYKLADDGYQLATGSAAEWSANFDRNIAARNWFVMPLYQPNYLNRVAKMRVLEEPKQLLGGADKAYLVLSKDFYATLDKHTWKTLQRMALSNKAVTEMDYLVNVKKLDAQYAARNWMAAHPDTVNYWLQPDSEE